ncbi:hypothetical protein BC833DRAFT_622381 [Globomyces pollinis-pini]|nr:hypothetical protein BC833DRAFT_622381 [Globomyces pollinis-pini]
MTELNPIQKLSVDFTPKRIVLCPVDASKQTPKVLDWAKKYFFNTESDLVILLYVYQSANSSFASFTTKEMIQKAEHDITQGATRLMREYITVIQNGNLHVEGYITHGDPRTVITEQISNLKANCVLMGRRGLGPIKSSFMGSVSNHVLHTSEVPVLVIP